MLFVCTSPVQVHSEYPSAKLYHSLRCSSLQRYTSIILATSNYRANRTVYFDSDTAPRHAGKVIEIHHAVQLYVLSIYK